MAQSKHFLASEIHQGAPDSSLFHVFSLPFEETTSYGKGTKDGPAAIIEASNQLELWDGKSLPAESGIFTWPPLKLKGSAEGVQHTISQQVTSSVRGGHIPVCLGGEHSVSFGAIRAVKQELELRGQDLAIIQFDAHADLRDSYEGTIWSHASVMKRVSDLGVYIMQIGVRAFCKEEAETRLKLGDKIKWIDGEEAASLKQKDFKLPKKMPDNVYITLDVDGFDPSIIPGTGTPVPGGLGWYQVKQMIEAIASQKNIVGFDLVEYAPNLGRHGDAMTCAQLVYNTMGAIARSRS